MEPDRLVVGRIVKAHGIRGEVGVEVLSDAPERFEPGARLSAGGRDLTVDAARPHQGRLLVKFAEVPDRTVAEALRNVELTIDASAARELPAGSYYPHQLEGLTVVDTTGSPLGEWIRVEQTPAHDVWIVRTSGREVMVPAVGDVVRHVDLTDGRIVIDPPEGLF